MLELMLALLLYGPISFLALNIFLSKNTVESTSIPTSYSEVAAHRTFYTLRSKIWRDVELFSA